MRQPTKRLPLGLVVIILTLGTPLCQAQEPTEAAPLTAPRAEPEHGLAALLQHVAMPRPEAEDAAPVDAAAHAVATNLAAL